MGKTFFILAGEASGDTHGARLIEQLKALSPRAEFAGLGGPKMAAAGLRVCKDLSGMQVVGFWEVIKHYGFFRRVFFQLLEDMKKTKPDALICIDYPGLNVRFAQEAKKLGIPVLYYIVPQVWAWKPMRAKTMARCVDQAFCVFNFEPAFFERFGLKTTFVGHPLIDGNDPVPHIAKARALLKAQNQTTKIVSFLPGSRGNEVRNHLDIMLHGFAKVRAEGTDAVALVSLPRDLKVDAPDSLSLIRTDGTSERDVAILCAPEHADAYRSVARELNEIPVSHARLLCGASDFSVVKSGTSTLEAGLGGQPLCVMYKGGRLSYLIARTLVNIPVFSLVNIVLGRYAVPELLQGEVTPTTLANEIHRGLFDETYRGQQFKTLAELPIKLGGSGASQRAAQGILDFLK